MKSIENTEKNTDTHWWFIYSLKMYIPLYNLYFGAKCIKGDYGESAKNITKALVITVIINVVVYIIKFLIKKGV